MPQADGRRMSWGPVIEGSVAAWRTAHPRAVLANLEGRRDVTDSDVALLAGVLALNVSGCSGLSERAFEGCDTGSGLVVLDCSGCTAFTAATLARCGGGVLRELNMSYCSNPALGGEGALAPLRGLVALDASFCSQASLTSATLAPLGEGLLWLSLQGCGQAGLTGALCSYLPRLRHLALTLQEGAYAEAHFARFEGSALRSLSLWNAQAAAGARALTDATFGRALAGLEELALSFRAGSEGGAVQAPWAGLSRGAFAAFRGRLRRLCMTGAVPEVFKDAARAAALEVRGK